MNVHRFGKYEGKVPGLRKGVILTSSDGMALDDWFAGKTVLITSYNAGGGRAADALRRRQTQASTQGVVVNVALPKKEAEEARQKMRISNGVDDDDAKPKPDVSKLWMGVGGPVTDSDEWVHIHDVDDVDDARELAPSVYVGGDVEGVLDGLARNESRSVKLLYGRAVWAPGQLEFELMAGGWRIANATHALVFGTQLSF